MLVTSTPTGQSDGSIIRQFNSYVDTNVAQYDYDTQQENLSIWNKGNKNIILNVGSYTDQVILPMQTWQNDVDFTSFTVNTTSGASEFLCTAKDYNNKVDYQFSKLSSELNDIVQQIQQGGGGGAGVAINDSMPSTTTVYSSSKIDTALNNITKYEITLDMVTGATDYDKVVNALTLLNQHGGGTLLLDRLITLTNPIIISNNVTIKATNNVAGFKRGFDKSVDGNVILLKSNTVLDGIVFDGNSTNITVANGDGIYYEDITTDLNSKHFIIKNCTFNNSCGSFITSASSDITVENNVFGEYIDHAVYVGGRSWITSYGYVSCDNVKIRHNQVNAITTGTVFKIRNGLNYYYLENNTVNAPNAQFMSIDVAQGTNSTAPLRDNKNIYINKNIVNCTIFISSLCEIGSAINQNIHVHDNIITASNYPFLLGDYPQGGWQYGAYIKNMQIINNDITITTTKNLAVINGNIGIGSSIIFKSNNINCNTQSVICIMGDTPLFIFQNNTVINSIATGSGANTLITGTPAPHMAYNVQSTGNWFVKDNIFYGKMYQIWGEDLTGVTIYSNVKSKNNLYIINNLSSSDYMFIGVNVVNDTSNLITAFCTYKNNTVIATGGKMQLQYPSNHRLYDKLYYKPNSVATDISTLKDDFNDLLDRLARANIIDVQ